MMASVAAINNLSGHAHNPRGNLWFNDESTYGHKLLMKMGWNKGKGLGKNEDGIKENLKVKFRSTNSGLGFKNDAYANIMKTEYESILTDLAAEYSCPRTTNLNKNADDSDEEPVQKSKVVNSKLRYPKLFFGKDVTKYSEKDMKSIFICSAPLKNIEEKSENNVISDKKDVEPSQTYSSSFSISDYFAKKMEEKRNNTLNKNSGNTLINEQTSLESKSSETPILIFNKSITSKRKLKDSQIDIERESIDVEEPNQVATEVENTEHLALSSKKSSRKRKKYEIDIQGSEVKPCTSNITKEEVLENSLCKKISYNSNLSAVENITNQNSSRHNKKRKLPQAFENDSVESFKNTICEIASSLPPTKKKKRKNKRYFPTVDLASENSVRESDNTPTEIHEETNLSLQSVGNELSNNTDCSKKKKKSKKKLKEKLKSCLRNKRGSYSIKNVSFNESVSYRMIDTEIESVDSLACIENLDENTASCKLIDSDQNSPGGDAYSEEKTTPNEQNSVDNICAKEQDNVSEESGGDGDAYSEEKTTPDEQNSVDNNCKEQDKVLEESDEKCILSGLPSSKSSHYNAWVESQRQALQMQLYKKMLKSIKNHKILKTTNLLSVKGYGNWGYK